MPVPHDGHAIRMWFSRLNRRLGIGGAKNRTPLSTQLAVEQARAAEHTALIDALVSGLPDPVVVVGKYSRVVAFNASAGALAPALRRGDPVSISLRMPELVEAIQQVGTSGKPQRIEFSDRLPSGRWWEAFVAPIAVPVLPAEFLLITLHDLSALRRVEEIRADFVANASHELRTPLASLTGFIETLQGPARDDAPARERFLGIMRDQAWRMARLIDDLLSLSRIELRAHLRPDKPVEIVPIVRQVVDSLQTLARDRGVAIEVEAPEEALVVLGDRDELIRLFENLIENGLKYGENGKRVEVTLAGVDGSGGNPEARVSVRDYGVGIAGEHLPRLTERFYRVDVGESRAQGGTGLGLALVKHILSRHQGRLGIESKLGEGATFTVRLPLAKNSDVLPET